MSSKQDITNAFKQEQGVIDIGGIDALVRLTLDQVRAEAAVGLSQSTNGSCTASRMTVAPR